MIYEININDVPAALTNGASIIIVSGDSSLALVQSPTPIESLASYENGQLSLLLAETKWRQPCKDCEV